MAIKVLVVDDSNFFRRRVSDIINASPFLEVIATANNGQQAIEMVMQHKPDVITMDIEMPVMDGITAVKKIMASAPTPILMFSSLTYRGATATLDALEAGACDFLPKKFDEVANNKYCAVSLLQQRIRALALHKVKAVNTVKKLTSNTTTFSNPLTKVDHLKASNIQISHAKTNKTFLGNSKPVTTMRTNVMPSSAVPSSIAPSRVIPKNTVPAFNHQTVTPTHHIPVTGSKLIKASGKSYRILAIGTSTGGPVALQKVLANLPANFKLPIVLIQHMPGTFTKAFAERLNSHCQISVKEAENNDLLKPGCAYLAPGGKQMVIAENGQIKIHEGNESLQYKPSVDLTFASLAKVYSDKVLAIVLTGMGSDGRDGAQLLKSKGAEIWAQDEKSCVVYGMPKAVTQAGVTSQSIALEEIAKSILVELKYE